ncbi:hypothetical protein SEPB62_04610 [Salmonella enterica subsp. enterica serovar Paratyphi B str. SARA62]|nr:hypothetical protein SEPB62_04610 [Salmonella enterica subsp. enterica serovar Paratyphi B str. SARA62]ESF87988.1 hypothetical protein SEEPB585_21790 [Salmonella enterica subsp. enterica serovar Paratyphi B str. ATCC BAA-1585]
MYQRLKNIKYYLVILAMSAFPHGLVNVRFYFLLKFVNDIHVIYIVYFF